MKIIISQIYIIITKILYHENNGAVQYKHYRFTKTSSAKWSQVTVPLIVNILYGVMHMYLQFKKCYTFMH